MYVCMHACMHACIYRDVYDVELGELRPCSEIADSIVATGRRALEEAREKVRAFKGLQKGLQKVLKGFQGLYRFRALERVL